MKKIGLPTLLFVASALLIFAVSGEGFAPPPPGGNPDPDPGNGGGGVPLSSGAVGPIGIPDAHSNPILITPEDSWIEWRDGGAHINSSNPNAVATTFRSGALGRVATVRERQGRTVFAQDYWFLELPLWQQEAFGQVPERIEFLPGVRIYILTSWGWQLGTLESLGDSFSIINGIPTQYALYPLEVSVP